MKKWVFVLIAIIMATGLVLYIWSNTIMQNGGKPVANGENTYAIVLGARVKETGEPSLALRYRLDETVEYLRKYPHVKVIVSGGQGEDEPVSEADFMFKFLTEAGIEEERIIREDASTSTYENLLFSKELLPDGETAVTIISSDFHLARAKMLAEKLDLEVDVVASKTPKVVEKKMRFRERLALLKTVIVGR